METRRVDASQGWQWIVAGARLFGKSPLIWIVLTIILLLIAVVLGLVPWLGQFLFYLLTPIFLAGLMHGCRALEADEELEIGHLFAGFQKNTSHLVTIGGIYLVGQVLILGVMMLIGGGIMMNLFLGGPQAVDMDAMMQAAGGIAVAALLGMLLSIPLLMAVWFAPVLVVFHDLPAFAALQLSFSACMKNTVAFLVYGLVILLLMVVAILPFGLGLLVLLPITVASVYTSYKDIFVPESAGQLSSGSSD